MNVILFDDPVSRTNLLPLTYTRPVAGIRCGILTIKEKWEKWLDARVSFSTVSYLQAKFPTTLADDNLWINGGVCPDDLLVSQIQLLKIGEGLVHGQSIIALRTPEDEVPEVILGNVTMVDRPIIYLDQVWKIFQYNAEQIKTDMKLITSGRKSEAIADPHTIVYQSDDIFVEEGVYIRAAVLNAETGPIYLGKGSIIQEGSLIRGPFALGEGAHLNMGAKIRGNVSLGPYSKAGGEVSNTVIFGYSNKAHDGFLGSSVIGEWCNLGADTNTSNLKNTYEEVKLWNYGQKGFARTGLQFCGLMMGDHSKAGINTMFNTGTVVGVASNVYGSGFPRNFIPSFTMGGASGFNTFSLKNAFAAADRSMERRNMHLNDTEKGILEEIFKQESGYRVWEKK